MEMAWDGLRTEIMYVQICFTMWMLSIMGECE